VVALPPPRRAIDMPLDRPSFAVCQFVFTRVKGRRPIFSRRAEDRRAARKPGGRATSQTLSLPAGHDTRSPSTPVMRVSPTSSSHQGPRRPGDRNRRRLRHPQLGRNDHRGPSNGRPSRNLAGTLSDGTLAFQMHALELPLAHRQSKHVLRTSDSSTSTAPGSPTNSTPPRSATPTFSSCSDTRVTPKTGTHRFLTTSLTTPPTRNRHDTRSDAYIAKRTRIVTQIGFPTPSSYSSRRSRLSFAREGLLPARSQKLEPDNLRLAKTTSRSALGFMTEMAFESGWSFSDNGGSTEQRVERSGGCSGTAATNIRPIELAKQRSPPQPDRLTTTASSPRRSPGTRREFNGRITEPYAR